MRRRPVCILCMLLVVFLCVTDWLGFSLIRGNPLPQSVQTWIRKHPESTICGEVVRCRENEDFQSVYLRNTYLIYNSEKVSIDNIKVYLKQKKKPCMMAETIMHGLFYAPKLCSVRLIISSCRALSRLLK